MGWLARKIENTINFVFDLSRFAGKVRGLGLVLNLAIRDLRGRRHHRRTASTPLRSATRGVRS